MQGQQPKCKLLRRIRKKRFTVQRKEISGAGYCLVCTATGYVPWEQIRSIAGKNVQFLLSSGIQPPADLPVFEGKRLLSKLLEREFLKQLKRTRPAKLTVVDYDGRHMDEIADYFQYAGQIRVITGQVEQYTAKSMELLRKLGAPLLITRDIHAAADSSLLYAPAGIRGRFLAPGEMLSVTLTPEGLRGGHLCYPKGIKCAAELDSLLPAGVDQVQFLCALYELSGFQRLEQIKLDIGLYI